MTKYYKGFNKDMVGQIIKAHFISQLVILPIITPDTVLVEWFPTTDRGNSGFGSTGI